MMNAMITLSMLVGLKSAAQSTTWRMGITMSGSPLIKSSIITWSLIIGGSMWLYHAFFFLFFLVRAIKDLKSNKSNQFHSGVILRDWTWRSLCLLLFKWNHCCSVNFEGGEVYTNRTEVAIGINWSKNTPSARKTKKMLRLWRRKLGICIVLSSVGSPMWIGMRFSNIWRSITARNSIQTAIRCARKPNICNHNTRYVARHIVASEC